MTNVSTDPIALVSPQEPIPRALLEVPGAFFWWYLDLLDARGTGIVVIWSFGLPFLPGYGSSARRGAAECPGQRPSLNVAVYEEGRPVAYVLQEMAPADVEWSDDYNWRFGKSHFHRERNQLRLKLTCPLAGGGDLSGTVRVQGNVCEPPDNVEQVGYGAISPAESGSSHHGWTPLLVPATGEAELHLGNNKTIQIQGRAYHDRNASDSSLDKLDIDEWFWGRASYEKEERIIYWLKGARGEKTLALRLRQGEKIQRLHDCTLQLEPAGKARYGMPAYRHVRVRHGNENFMDLRVGEPIDNGPFYLRAFLNEATGQKNVGFCEGVVPARVDLGWQRPFVRMRVQQMSGKNSLFLPLFNGPRQGRWGRMWRHWTGGGDG